MVKTEEQTQKIAGRQIRKDQIFSSRSYSIIVFNFIRYWHFVPSKCTFLMVTVKTEKKKTES